MLKTAVECQICNLVDLLFDQLFPGLKLKCVIDRISGQQRIQRDGGLILQNGGWHLCLVMVSTDDFACGPVFGRKKLD